MPSLIVNQLTKVDPYPQRDGSPLNVRLMTVAASQTLYPGDWVIQTAAGSAETVEQALALPGSNSTATTSTTGQRILGVVVGQGIATGAGGTEAVTGRSQVMVALFDDSTSALLRIFNTTAANAEPQDVNEYKTNYCLARYRAASATEWFYVLSTTTTDGILNVVNKEPESNAGDDYGVVRVKPLVATRMNVA